MKIDHVSSRGHGAWRSYPVCLIPESLGASGSAAPAAGRRSQMRHPFLAAGPASRRLCASTVLCAMAASAMIAQAGAEVSRDPRSILLRAETIDAHSAQPFPGDGSALRSSGGRSNERTYLVHLEDAGDARWRRAVREATGKRLERYIPHNTFLLDLDPEALQRTQALVGTAVLWLGELKPHHKLASAALHKLDKQLEDYSAQEAGRSPGRSARGGAGPGPREKAAAPPDAVLVVKLRFSNAATLAPHFEHALQLAGFAVTVTAATPQKLHVRRHAADPHTHTGSRVVSGAGSAGKGASAVGPWAQAVGEWLSLESEVLWVEPKARIKVRNRYAAMTVQGGFRDGERPCLPCSHTVHQCPSCPQTGRTPIWELGLRGEGEIVGCGDTGIDVDSCFFWDSAPAGGGRPGPPLAPKVSASHRKLVSYKASGGTGTGDASDDVRGHGTHVVGSIAGSVDASFAPTGDVGEHGGMAPAAKVAFFDLEKTGGGIDIPDDIQQDYYKWAYDAGARVHSNSWGDDSNDYTVMTAETDEFVYNHPDMLVLFAAGNDGDKDPPHHTVGAPATCKNCLSVGATQSDERDALKDGGRLEVFVEAEGSNPSVTGAYLATGASFGPSLGKEGQLSQAGEITLLSYIGQACEALNKSSAAFKAFQAHDHLIAVVERGKCVFVDKVRHAQDAGAVAVIVTNNVDGDPISLGGEDQDINISAVMITKEDGEAMYNMTRDAPGKALSVELAPAHSLPNFNQDNLADFSSLGPTSDGRLKPDLVAPGQDIHSAFSDGQPYSYQCDEDGKSDQAALTRMSGTSMATPIVAGAAALVRQYFRTGKYHEVAGAAASWMAQNAGVTGFAPSAALLRAVLINGAQDLAILGGRRGSKGPLLLPPPSMEIGYGRLNLAKSLRVPNSVSPSPSLIVLDGFAQSALTTTQRAVVGHGAVHRHCFRVGSASLGEAMALKVTLAWTDPPAESNSAAALVHNLDLAVYHAATAKVEYGNHLARPARQRGGVDEAELTEQELTDIVNPTEQVVIAAPHTRSVYVVYVMGTKVVRSRPVAEGGAGGSAGGSAEEESTQEYALAITGKNLAALSLSAPECMAIACPKDCSGQGECVDGRCVCKGTFWGVDCTMQKSCPRGIGRQTCSGHGVCDFQLGACTCEEGWMGRACEAYSCVSGSTRNVSVSLNEQLLVQSGSAGSPYASKTACAWQIQAQPGQDGNGQGAYLMASIEEMEIESAGFAAASLDPGCDGSEECASDCEYDALHVVRGMLEPEPDEGFSSDDHGEPCHEWALSQPGYIGTYCGSLEYLTGGQSIVIADMAQGEALSLVFCSDVAVQPGRGFAVSFSAVPCPHNCSGHGTCTGHSRAFVSEPVCVCAPGWAGSFCNQKSMVCDPNVPLNSSALGSGSYMCVEVSQQVPKQTVSPDHGSWLGRTKEAHGLLVCAPGFSGQDCTVPSCGGEVNITWTNAAIASHDANRSSNYPDGASCRWLYKVAAAAPGAMVTVNVSLLDLEFQRDILEISCVGTDAASLHPATAMVGRFTGNAPCPAWPACMEGAQDQAGGDTCSHSVGDEASHDQPGSAGYCLLQREWRWVAVQVHESDCAVLSVSFTSDSSKTGAGFTAQIFPTNSQLMRPFVEATITFFNHSIADLHNKTEAVLSAVALAAQVPQRDVLLTHVVGHMNSGRWRAGEQDSYTGRGTRDGGRRPVDAEGRQAHQHVTVTIKVLAHQTDAPAPTAWALYHRLALDEPLTGKYNNTNSTRRPHRSLWNSATGRHSMKSNWAGAGKGRVESGEDAAWGRRSSVDDTLWAWALDGQWAASGMWKDSEGDGTAIIEVLLMCC